MALYKIAQLPYTRTSTNCCFSMGSSHSGYCCCRQSGCWLKFAALTGWLLYLFSILFSPCFCFLVLFLAPQPPTLLWCRSWLQFLPFPNATYLGFQRFFFGLFYVDSPKQYCQQTTIKTTTTATTKTKRRQQNLNDYSSLTTATLQSAWASKLSCDCDSALQRVKWRQKRGIQIKDTKISTIQCECDFSIVRGCGAHAVA